MARASRPPILAEPAAQRNPERPVTAASLGVDLNRRTFVDDAPAHAKELREMLTEPDVGVLVRLRSGGPIMTMEQVLGAPDMRYAHCVWFDARGLWHTGNFRLGALMPAPAETAPDPPPA